MTSPKGKDKTDGDGMWLRWGHVRGCLWVDTPGSIRHRGGLEERVGELFQVGRMVTVKGFPNGSAGEESACNAGDTKDAGLIRKIPWRRKWQHTRVFLPWRIPWKGGLADYSLWRCSVTTERLSTQEESVCSRRLGEATWQERITTSEGGESPVTQSARMALPGGTCECSTGNKRPWDGATWSDANLTVWLLHRISPRARRDAEDNLGASRKNTASNIPSL